MTPDDIEGRLRDELPRLADAIGDGYDREHRAFHATPASRRVRRPGRRPAPAAPSRRSAERRGRVALAVALIAVPIARRNGDGGDDGATPGRARKRHSTVVNLVAAAAGTTVATGSYQVDFTRTSTKGKAAASCPEVDDRPITPRSGSDAGPHGAASAALGCRTVRSAARRGRQRDGADGTGAIALLRDRQTRDDDGCRDDQRRPVRDAGRVAHRHPRRRHLVCRAGVVWEFGGADYGSTGAAPGSSLARFASLVEGTLGRRDGACCDDEPRQPERVRRPHAVVDRRRRTDRHRPGRRCAGHRLPGSQEPRGGPRRRLDARRGEGGPRRGHAAGPGGIPGRHAGSEHRRQRADPAHQERHHVRRRGHRHERQPVLELRVRGCGRPARPRRAARWDARDLPGAADDGPGGPVDHGGGVGRTADDDPADQPARRCHERRRPRRRSRHRRRPHRPRGGTAAGDGASDEHRHAGEHHQRAVPRPPRLDRQRAAIGRVPHHGRHGHEPPRGRRERPTGVPGTRRKPPGERATAPYTEPMAVPKIVGIETEYGVSLRGAADPNPVLASSLLINGYVEQRRIGWDFEDESPGRDARGFAREGAQPPEVETHLVNAVLTNGARYYVDHAHPEYSTPGMLRPAAGGVVRQGGGAHPRPFDGRGPAPACRRARRSSSTRTTATARATRTAATRTTSSTGRCRSCSSCARSCRGS